MKDIRMWILACFQLLYGLSWMILFGGVMLMCFRPNPSEKVLEAIMLTLIVAFYYIAAYFVLRGLGRALLRGWQAGAMPVSSATAANVRIRRVILEEVTPLGPGQPAYRVVHEEQIPTYERRPHAR
jgi:hypothetical protein